MNYRNAFQPSAWRTLAINDAKCIKAYRVHGLSCVSMNVSFIRNIEFLRQSLAIRGDA